MQAVISLALSASMMSVMVGAVRKSKTDTPQVLKAACNA
jgi:hypothetical protein